ncbi:hypothetical protein GCM10020221_31680 [Streptomyces thioluteus]|uniref:Histidine kinase n=1 Tax=Streptomyces thioluteus TaxID=66431 RepID=A0ABP6JHR2_STRTU
MTTRWREEQTGAMVAQASRRVAWIRMGMAVPLFLAGGHPAAATYGAWFDGLLAAYLLWAFGRLLWVHHRPVTGVAGAATPLVVDLVMITGLAAVSGGPDSSVRYAYFMWAMATILWQLPGVTAVFGAVCMLCYAAMSLPQALSHPGWDSWSVLVDESYLLWTVVASVVVAALLAERTRRVSELMDNRELLLDDALAAETRERSRVADALHDGARPDAARRPARPGGGRGERPRRRGARRARPGQDEVRRTVREMREIIFNLHPQVLAAAGLGAALEAAGGAVRPPGRLPDPLRHPPARPDRPRDAAVLGRPRSPPQRGQARGGHRGMGGPDDRGGRDRPDRSRQRHRLRPPHRPAPPARGPHRSGQPLHAGGERGRPVPHRQLARGRDDGRGPAADGGR